MARSVADAATILSIIAGRDPRDNFTLAQPPVVPDYTKALDAGALQGARLGVPRKLVELLDLVVVAVKEREEARLCARGALDTAEADVVARTLEVAKVPE